MSSLFKSRSQPSSRRASVADQTTRPFNSEIFTAPEPGCQPKSPITYTSEQQSKIEELRKYAFSLLLPESDPYHVWEKRFLSDPGCIPRYMRAAKWKLDNGKERIKGTLEWRRDFKPELIQASDVGPEAETGKIILNGFDLDGRPILYLRPGRENQKTSPRQIRHLIFHLERAIDFMPPGVETVMIICDFASATSGTTPSIGTARQVLTILQKHYVERMGRAIVVNIPWFINAFFQAITPFLDPVTKDKMRFNPKLPELVPVAQLDAEFGGDNNFKFDYDTYWNTIVQFCHLAPDGGRLDKNGQPCVPPLGRGAKAAFEGSAETASEPSHRDTSPSASHIAAGTPIHESPRQVISPTADGLHSDMQNLSVAAASDHKHDITTSATDDASSTDSFGSAKERLSIEEVSVVKTAEGPPAGPVVFDHPPTEAEQKQAEKLMQDVGKAA